MTSKSYCTLSSLKDLVVLSAAELMNMKGRQVRVGGSTGQGPPPLQWTVQTEGTEDGKSDHL